jgi:hypothetical protein
LNLAGVTASVNPLPILAVTNPPQKRQRLLWALIPAVPVVSAVVLF